MDAKQDAALLNAVYHSVAMGAGAYEHMLKVTSDATMKDYLTKGMRDYHALEAATLGRLHRLHESPEDVGTMTKLMSRAGVRLNSAMDASTSGLAAIAKNNAAMGIQELNTALSAAPQASMEVRRIAEAYIGIEKSNIENMNAF